MMGILHLVLVIDIFEGLKFQTITLKFQTQNTCPSYGEAMSKSQSLQNASRREETVALVSQVKTVSLTYHCI